ncbi:transposase IS66 family protein [Palleronia aestuarii]|uniref:Transposase IS66 family protein n=1 Tax=Palleronia aestuarii TaxID=568105 RepID=A0A2W7NBG1_9RHOB|nr:transposase IS66 family protein [Palleronia aestuarii]
MTALLEPLSEAIGRHVLASRAIHADDTPVRMLAPGTGKTQTARLWIYVRDERPWAGPAPPSCGLSRPRRGHGPFGPLYRFSSDRKGAHPARHLAGFEGWMHADGYVGFEELYRSEGIRLAHVRRKFVDVHRSQGSAIAEEAIARIAELYAVEKAIRGSPPAERARARQEYAAPIFDALEAWLVEQLLALSGKTPLAAAIRYALNRLPRLRPYLTDGAIEINHNGPNVPCAAALSVARTGSSPARLRAGKPLPSPQPSSRPPS